MIAGAAARAARAALAARLPRRVRRRRPGSRCSTFCARSGARSTSPRSSDGLIPSPPPEVFGITEPAQAAWTGERLTRSRCARGPSRSTRRTALPGTYIRCTEGPLVPSFEGFAARIEGEVVEIATGHDAMITRPADLAGADCAKSAHNWHRFVTNACRAVTGAAHSVAPHDRRPARGRPAGRGPGCRTPRTPRVPDPRPQPSDPLRRARSRGLRRRRARLRRGQDPSVRLARALGEPPRPQALAGPPDGDRLADRGQRPPLQRPAALRRHRRPARRDGALVRLDHLEAAF